MLGEVEPAGCEHHAIAHFARGLQVLIEQGGRHGQRLAGVVETCRVRRIHRKLPRGTDVHAGKVADAVVVLGIAQAVHQHRTGIAIVLSRLVHAHGLDPVDHFLADVRGRLRQRLWRHLFGGQSLQHLGPARIVADHGGHCGVRPKIELRSRCVAAMASDAIACKKGTDGLRESTFQLGVGNVGSAHRRYCDTYKH